MNNFFRLIHNENIKLYKKKILWIFAFILIAIMIINIVITFKNSEPHPKDWKSQVETEVKEMNEELNDNSTFDVVKRVLKPEIAIKEYQLENNITPLYKDTAFGFVKSTLDFVGVITLVIIIISSSIVSQEYAWGTIKLLLMRPIKRYKILLAKYISIIFNALMFLTILFLVSLLVGIVFFGLDSQSYRYVYESNGVINDIPIFIHFLQYLGSKFIGMTMIASFALMISTLFNNNTLAITLSIIIQFGGSIVSNLLTNLWNKEFPKYFFFSNTDLYQYVEGTSKPGMSLTFSSIVLIIYFFIFMLISIIIFNKKDIRSK